MKKVKVVLFKPSGKYYTSEEWLVPERPEGRDPLGPYDMAHSPDFRRINGGAVLVESQEPWGYPHLFPSIDQPRNEENRPAVGAPKDWPHGYLECGCRNNGNGRHVR